MARSASRRSGDSGDSRVGGRAAAAPDVLVPPSRSAVESVVPLVPGSIANHTSCLILKVGQVMFRLMEDQLSALGLRIRHYSLLATLADLGSMSQGQLGAYLRIDGATMVATIDDLEGLGLVERRRAQRDRRQSVVSITEDGRAMLRRVEELMRSLDEEYLQDVTANQQTQLRWLMQKLSQGKVLATAFDKLRGG
jgi:DNA-binding MarR family transcriptional regulator